jgi:hypothetical protein
MGHSTRTNEDGYSHIVLLSRQAVDVLRALKLLTGNCELVFPGAMDKKKPMSNNTLLYALCRLGYRGRMTGHGFRGLASTILHEHGFEEAHIELQLAHMKRDNMCPSTIQPKVIVPHLFQVVAEKPVGAVERQREDIGHFHDRVECRMFLGAE